MEVGAVKQAFNNEVILLKKKLNQAKIQIIHKLTRKAKQLTEKKAPDPLKEKLKRKAESAVREVLIIKKIKPKDIAKFIVTHKGELNSYLNKPEVDEEKACARLLLHKVLQDKYKFIRDRFSNVPIKDLFMSRLERRKMKKEAKEKQKNKKNKKDQKVSNSEGGWNVEDIPMADNRKLSEGDDEFSDQNEGSDEEINDDKVSDDESDNSEADEEASDDFEVKDVEEHDSESNIENSDNESKKQTDNNVKPSPKLKPQINNVKSKVGKNEIKPNTVEHQEIKKVNPPKEIVKKNPAKKQKELNKSKHFNEKILQKKMKKDSDAHIVENKIVDPFFITATGENYMSVVEPRAPDEIKDEHMQGNRKLRRAVMFGHVPKSKLRQNNNYYNEDRDNRFNKPNGYEKGNNFKGNHNDRPQFNDRRNFNDRKTFNNDFNEKRGFNRNYRNNVEEPEKLHPSWEAKRKKSGILPFEGKKIVFDES